MNELQEKQLERAKQHAISKDGECLSTEYKNSERNLVWKCSNSSHKEWCATFSNVIYKGSWCSECGNLKAANIRKNSCGFEIAKSFAKSKDGFCLSTEYINANKPMLWKCSNSSHKEWYAPYSSVINKGLWCRDCGNIKAAESNKNPYGLETANSFAKTKNGHCLSTEYQGARKKMVWKCATSNHKEWFASYTKVVNDGSWCPECGKRNLSENRVRLIFETFYGQSFSSAKPKWNVNFLTGKCLELDGYCEMAKVAFEHDGEHHKKIVSYNNHEPIINDLIYQKCKDYEKKQNCKRQGVLLINIQILEPKDRNVFQLFLENVINSCKKCGLEMTFTDDQLITLEKEFYTV